MKMTPYTHLSDEDLMLLFRSGNEQAFENLVDRYKGKIFSYLYRMLKNYEDAEEKTWDVFYKIDHYKNKFTNPESGGFAKWIFTIAKNTGLDFLDSEGRKPDIEYERIIQIPTEQLSPEEELIKKVEETEKQKLLTFLLNELKEILIIKPDKKEEKKLGELQYEASRLYYTEGYSQKKVLDYIIPMAEEYSIGVTNKDLNNWLSGDRILKKLCCHLLDEHRDRFEPHCLTNVIRETLLLSDVERKVIESHWIEGKSPEMIGHEESIPLEEIQQILKKAVERVQEAFPKQVKEAISRRPRKKKHN